MFSNAEEMRIILKWGKKTRLKLEAHHNGHLGKLCKHIEKQTNQVYQSSDMYHAVC